MKQNKLLRELPQIDQVLRDQRLVVFFGVVKQAIILESAREIIEEVRMLMIESEEIPQAIDYDEIVDKIVTRVMENNQNSLRKIINATGIILHTNLGRAKLSEAACRRVLEVAGNYSTLEYNVLSGTRGDRNDHVENLVKKILGVEAAMIVNNNAAATTLCLSAMAAGREVVLSRGELVEIGGSFRIPEIMKLSGSALIEVGTTNKTRLEDYARAIHAEKTGVLMKVHPSNYKILGFTEEVTLAELVKLGREKDIPVVYDLGSGLMVDLKDHAVYEPTVMESLKTGIDIILFSGDKLMGGPQAGIIAGKKKYVDAMRSHPLARILRIDKMTLAALEETLRSYKDPKKAMIDIPVLSMITTSKKTLKERADKMVGKLTNLSNELQINILEAEEQVGGGSAPTIALPGYAVSIQSEHMSSEKMERALREWHIPIIARIFQGKVLIDMRTITEDEVEIVIQALTAITEKIEK